MPAVGGFVFDSSGAPVDREIRLYRRDTGELLGKTRSSGGAGDPHYANVSLLLHCDGADGSTTFTDSSATPKAVTAIGDARISTAQTLFGGSTGYFDGTGDALSVANSSALDFGTGDFTIECWVYIAGNSAPDIDGNRSFAIVSPWGESNVSGYLLAITGNSSTTGIGINFDSWSAGSTTAGTFYRAAATVTQGAWHHIAATVQAGVRRLFLDGVQLSATQSNFGAGYAGFETFGRPLCVGGTFNAQYPMRLNGHLRELRITKGLARYTSDFTPPSTPFLDILSGAGGTLAFGEYYLATTHTGEVQVVCMDDANGPLENDLILRTFPV